MRRNNITISKEMFKLFLWGTKSFCDNDLNNYILKILSKKIEFEMEVAVTPQVFSQDFQSFRIYHAKLCKSICYINGY